LKLYVYYVEKMPQGQKQSGVWVGMATEQNDIQGGFCRGWWCLSSRSTIFQLYCGS